MPARIRSDRVSTLVQSEIRAMTRACNAVGGVNLGQGICDVPTPPLVKEAAIAAIRGDESTYTRYDGTAKLRGALSRKLARHNGITADPETEIVATIGATGALASTLMALANPGDEILLFEPYYGYHLNTAIVAGMTPRFLKLDPPDFTIDFDAVRDAFGPNTRAVLVNTPTNPSGRVWTRDELETLGQIAAEHDALVITDEVYEYMVYPGAEHVSAASIPSLRDRTITIGSYSKTFSITGWRIGFVTAPADLAGPIGLVNDLFYVCAPAPLQQAVADAIDTLGDEYYADMGALYLKKRDRFCSVLSDIGLTPIVPRGAYYVLADISSLGCDTAKDGAMKLLHEAGVASVPGSAFYTGSTGETLTRFCYAKQDVDLDRACEQLTEWARTR